MAVSPNKAAFAKHIWPSHYVPKSQGRGKILQQMRRQFMNAQDGAICIIFGDILSLSKAHIQRVFQTLASNTWVFGPVTEGGYWLIGAKGTAKVPLLIFQNVRLSTQNALSDTIKTLPNAQIAFIETLSDIDTESGLKKYAHKSCILFRAMTPHKFCDVGTHDKIAASC